MSLPTYPEAVAGPSVWVLVKEYVEMLDLHTLCLVNSEFNDVFSPLLWSDPCRVLATFKDALSRLERFVRISYCFSKDTRDLTLSFDFSSLYLRAGVQIYTDSHFWMSWHFPKYYNSIRFMILNRESVYLAADQAPDAPFGSLKVEVPQLLLFSAAHMNIHGSFITASNYFADIMFLDLSYTLRDEDWTRDMSTMDFPNLRVLKLRGLRLTDQTLPKNLIDNSLRLWSLNLRDNKLTDSTLLFLMESCLLLPIRQPTPVKKLDGDEGMYEYPPTYSVRSSDRLLGSINNCPLRDDDMDGFTAHLKANGDLTLGNRHPLNEGGDDHSPDPFLLPTGLTQLYLSNNKFTAPRIRELLSTTNRLQVVDIGSVLSRSLHIPRTIIHAQPHTANLLHRSTGSRMQKIRIHHSVITHVPTILPKDSNDLSRWEFRPGDLKRAETVFGPREQAAWAAFDPLENYGISQVTLTGVPMLSFGMVIESLLVFLRKCGEQEQRLKIAGRGGRRHYRAPRLLTGVRKVRLEFVRVAKTDSAASQYVSVSGDRDADTFLAESVRDFSFFGDSFSGGAEEAPTESYDDLVDVTEKLKEWRSTVEGKMWTGKLEGVKTVD